MSYLTLIGFIVAVILHSSKKTNLGTFHLRQSLGLVLTSVALSIIAIVPILGWIIGLFGWIALLVFWVMALISAIQGQTKPVPLIGEQFQKWFSGAFA